MKGYTLHHRRRIYSTISPLKVLALRSKVFDKSIVCFNPLRTIWFRNSETPARAHSSLKSVSFTFTYNQKQVILHIILYAHNLERLQKNYIRNVLFLRIQTYSTSPQPLAKELLRKYIYLACSSGVGEIKLRLSTTFTKQIFARYVEHWVYQYNYQGILS